MVFRKGRTKEAHSTMATAGPFVPPKPSSSGEKDDFKITPEVSELFVSCNVPEPLQQKRRRIAPFMHRTPFVHPKPRADFAFLFSVLLIRRLNV